jgi:hypothetical protein
VSPFSLCSAPSTMNPRCTISRCSRPEILLRHGLRTHTPRNPEFSPEA